MCGDDSTYSGGSGRAYRGSTQCVSSPEWEGGVVFVVYNTHMHGFHHLRARMRLSGGLEPFPAHGGFKRLFDYLMYAVGIFAPLALLPQIHQLYATRNASGLSLVTWALICMVNALWAAYGLVHRDTQLFLANVLMMVFNLSILIAIWLY